MFTQDSDRDRQLIATARRAAESLQACFSSALPRVRISGYDLVREIHRGGQGVVFEALQQSTHRNVAIKILHERFPVGSAGHIRFQREAHILAQLRHPNIVVVHDTGSIDGAPYLVMDCVEGEPLDGFLLRERPDVAATLRLFLSISEAVSAAHQRGVIHRDIKPSNIRVREDGAPCLLDFGLARPESGGNAVDEITRTDHFVGSLPWASPEQVSSTGERLDVRSDVYSLGLLLYFMLTGHMPYDVRGAPRQVIENILSATPAPLRSFRRSIDEDIETMTRKCLAKEPERRYQSAGELAADVRRWQNREPIAARRDSGVYLLRMFLQRYRWGVASALALLLSTSVGLGVTATLWRDAALERDRADQTRGFLERMLLSIDPAIAKGRDQTILREMLDSADREVQSSFPDRPELAASLRMTLGDIHRKLGRFPEAATHYRWALDAFTRIDGTAARQTIDAECSLAAALIEASKLDEAEPLCLSSLSRAEASLGKNHALTLDALSNLASLRNEQGRFDESEATAREAIARSAKPGLPPSRRGADLLFNLAVALNQKADYARSIELLREARGLYAQIAGEDAPDTLAVEAHLASVLLMIGQYAAAEPQLSAALRRQQGIMGPEHPDTLKTQNALGWCLLSLRRFADAAPVLEEAWNLRKKVLGPDHRETLSTGGAVMVALQHSGRIPEAVEVGAETLEARRRTLGQEHPDVLALQTNYALLLIDAGQAEAAIELLRNSFEKQSKVLPPDHPTTINTHVNLGRALWMLKKFDEAEAELQPARAACERRLGREHPLYRQALDYLSLSLEDQDRFSEATPLLRELLTMYEKSTGGGSSETRVALKRLAFALGHDGAHADAAALLRRWLAACEAEQGVNPSETLRARAELAFCLRDLGEMDESDQLFIALESSLPAADAPPARDLAIALLRHGQWQLGRDRDLAAATLGRARGMLEAVQADRQWLEIADGALAGLATAPP